MKLKYNIAEKIKELPDKEYFTVTEVSDLTGINRKTILQRLNDGTLKGKKLGNTWRIYRDSLLYEGEKEHENK